MQLMLFCDVSQGHLCFDLARDIKLTNDATLKIFNQAGDTQAYRVIINWD